MRNSVLPASIHAQSPQEQQATLKETVQKLEHTTDEVKGRIGKLMWPRTYALEHEAVELLEDWSQNGCPVDCGVDWDMEWIEEAIRRGPHISAKAPEAIECIRAENLQKVKDGYAKLVKWKDIRKNRPKKLKISPVAAIPHKSRKFRTILDLSFRLKYKWMKLNSVNSATKLQAPYEAMVQLGNCVQRLIKTLANNYDPEKPFAFSKLDIKDGFWRIAVSDEDAYNFCYVLPTVDPLEDIGEAEIVIPNSLQMGWNESPPYFCAATSWKTCCWRPSFQNTHRRRQCWQNLTPFNDYRQQQTSPTSLRSS